MQILTFGCKKWAQITGFTFLAIADLLGDDCITKRRERVSCLLTPTKSLKRAWHEVTPCLILLSQHHSEAARMSTSAATAWRVEFINNSNAFAIYITFEKLTYVMQQLSWEWKYLSLSHESSREAPQIGQQSDGNGFYHWVCPMHY